MTLFQALNELSESAEEFAKRLKKLYGDFTRMAPRWFVHKDNAIYFAHTDELAKEIERVQGVFAHQGKTVLEKLARVVKRMAKDGPKYLHDQIGIEEADAREISQKLAAALEKVHKSFETQIAKITGQGAIGAKLWGGLSSARFNLEKMEFEIAASGAWKALHGITGFAHRFKLNPMVRDGKAALQESGVPAAAKLVEELLVKIGVPDWNAKRAAPLFAIMFMPGSSADFLAMATVALKSGKKFADRLKTCYDLLHGKLPAYFAYKEGIIQFKNTSQLGGDIATIQTWIATNGAELLSDLKDVVAKLKTDGAKRLKNEVGIDILDATYIAGSLARTLDNVHKALGKQFDEFTKESVVRAKVLIALSNSQFNLTTFEFETSHKGLWKVLDIGAAAAQWYALNPKLAAAKKAKLPVVARMLESALTRIGVPAQSAKKTAPLFAMVMLPTRA